MGPDASLRKVFVSHCSLDKPAVKKLVDALRARRIDVWYDDYEIAPGDNIVAKLNEGLDSCDVYLVVFSANTGKARWVSAELSVLLHKRIEEGRVVIPVILGEGAQLPPLFEPLARVRIDHLDGIVAAIDHRRVEPPVPGFGPAMTRHSVVLRLARSSTGKIEVSVALDDAVIAACTRAALPRLLIELRNDFLSGFRHATLRSPIAIARKAEEEAIAQLGRAMAALCLPKPAASALGELLDREGWLPGASIEVTITSEDPELASLPYESLRLPGSDRPLVDHPAVTMVRRPDNLRWPWTGPLPGPLKILVAVGAPDERKTASNVLDHERELQNLLDAVAQRRRDDNVEVRILEASDPATIGEALRRDQYHVLHITCHGMPGTLELDDEDGDAVTATADDLLEVLRRSQRFAPLIFLNCCHGAVDTQQTASLAQSLLHGGVPAVLAMQAAVSDEYGSALACKFFETLSSREGELASRALAHARRELESVRGKPRERGGDPALALPEYATATLFVAGIEAPLVNFGPDKQPLRTRPAPKVGGQVPQLSQDQLIGRRRELRHTLWVLRPPRTAERATGTRDGLHKGPALALVGIGGVGKSAIAGRAMRRLAEDGFLIASHVGPWDLGAIAKAVGHALRDSSVPALNCRGKELSEPGLDDERRLHLLAKTLGDAPLLLVLDDFERNLSLDGAAFLDPSLANYLAKLIDAAGHGRLLLTCRFPLPGFARLVATMRVGPLTDADVRKLMLRLPGLHAAEPAELHAALRTIGNHPRMLELLDAVVCGGVGRLRHVETKLRDLAARCGATPAVAPNLREAVQHSLVLGARDVSLAELLDIARQRGLDEILLQAAASNLPVHAAGIAHMLANGEPERAAVARVERALHQLEDMALVVRIPDCLDRQANRAERVFRADIGSAAALRGGSAAWVHRWIAEGLASCQPDDQWRDRWARAGRYRQWRARQEILTIEDLVEAVRCFLRAEAWDEAVADSKTVIKAYRHRHQIVSLAAFIDEVLRAVPPDHRSVPSLHDEAGDAHLVLGQFEQARTAYDAAFEIRERLTANEPERADFQRDLAVSYLKLGDLFLAMKQPDDARKAYAAARAIFEWLAGNESEFQLDLAAFDEYMGNLVRELGPIVALSKSYFLLNKAHTIDEPPRADWQREPTIASSEMDAVFFDFDQGDDARTAYAPAPALLERIAVYTPERADFQRNVAHSGVHLRGRFRGLCEGHLARVAHAASAVTRRWLAMIAHKRTDFLRGLARYENRTADPFRDLGHVDDALDVDATDLVIAEWPAVDERAPEDVQRHLATSAPELGDQSWDDEANKTYAAALAIGVRLAAKEPERTDHQRELAVSDSEMDDVFRALSQGRGDDARTICAAALSIIVRRAAEQPERTDHQRDLAVWYSRMGDLRCVLGPGDDARKAYAAALAILDRLTADEPERTDFQRDLAVSYSKIGHLFRDLGQRDDARNAYAAALAIIQRLATSAPERADFQRELAVSYSDVGDLLRDLGQRDDARTAYDTALSIIQRLATSAPERADFQRDLSASCIKLGDLFRDLGQGDDARTAYAAALAIRDRLAGSSPERADFRRELSISHNKMGDLFSALGQGNDAREVYAAALAIRQQLVAEEPERTDFQRDLSISYNRTGDLLAAMGHGDDARKAYAAALAIRERLTANEPTRADFQRDLAISYDKLGFLVCALGQATTHARPTPPRSRSTVGVA